MTKSQARVLKFIKDYIDLNGYSPSYIEIAEGCNYASAGNAFDICTKLVQQKKLVKVGDYRGHRQLEVVDG